ncbi:MAG: aminotransferase class I/II-fold pyridoxal phosphate-dependent enzyme [Proteobacteria bacterium]|nr:aminotransferase class I/II-fold pyridoxal phosphate-dependent enzyme [Pseudomonadota bacterium]
MKYASIANRLDTAAAYAWAIHDKARKRQLNGEDIILLSVGDPDFETPQAITQAAIDSLKAGRTHYGFFAGEPALRQAIADRHAEFTGQIVSVDQVVICPGAQNALYAVALCLVEPGDEVLVPEPRYVTYESVVDAAGATRIDVPLDVDRGFHLDPAKLEAAVTDRTRMILLNTPHNPTGMVMTREELDGVAQVALRHDLWVVCDEVYADLTFDVPHTSVCSLPQIADRSVSLGSLSKSHAMQGWRIGWVIAPPDLAQHLVNLVKPMHYGLSPFLQDAAVVALTEQHPETEAMHREYRERRDLVCSRINAMPGLACSWPEGSMFLLVDVRGTGLDGENFAWGLLDHGGGSLLPGTGFGASVTGHVRFSLTMPIAVLADACDRIERYARSLESLSASA